MVRAFFFAAALLLSFQASAATALPDFVELAEKQGQVVVNISTTQVVKNRRGQMFPFDENDPAHEFLRRFAPWGYGAPPGQPRDSIAHSLGSGFIIGSDGYILTNAHVIDGADEIVVRLNDTREYRAKLIGADKRTDVALLKIEAAGLPVARLGDPNKLKVGEWVVAIGAPFGLENSVTQGIVSAKGRSLPQENYVPFIQTDVAINPGNSGGPLFNLNGEVVGINSQIYSRSGGYMGLSFAIPIDVAMDIQGQLRTTGRVSRGRLGVVIQEVTKELAESFGLEKPQGAIISAVEKGGAAEAAGILPGDVLLRFNGKAVTSSADLPRMVAATRPGTRVQVQVWRKDRLKEFTVSLGEVVDDKNGQQRQIRSSKPEQAANRLGLVLSELSPAQKKQLQVSSGLLVEDVKGNAVRADLRSGDIILALINRGEVVELTSVDQFNNILSRLGRGTLTLLVRRGEVQNFVTIKGVAD